MTEIIGMLAVEDLRRLAEAGEVETVLVAFSDLYGRFLGKRFDVDFVLKHSQKPPGSFKRPRKEYFCSCSLGS